MTLKYPTHFQQNAPFNPTSPLSITLQCTSWPYGYKPIQLPKYEGLFDPAQFIMTYEATIASAGGDDPIMTKSFIMACEGPVASWYSYIQPLSNQSWVQLKERLKQDSNKTSKSSKRWLSTLCSNLVAYKWTENHYPSTFGDLCRKKHKLQTSLKKMQ